MRDVASQWAIKALHYRGILKRVVSSGARHSWFDKAMQPSNVEGGDHLIDVFADKIPRLHGAPIYGAAQATDVARTATAK